MENLTNMLIYIFGGAVLGYLWRYLTAKKKDDGRLPVNVEVGLLKREIKSLNDKHAALLIEIRGLKAGDKVKADESQRLTTVVRKLGEKFLPDTEYLYCGCGEVNGFGYNICTWNLEGEVYKLEVSATIVSADGVVSHVPLKCGDYTILHVRRAK